VTSCEASAFHGGAQNSVSVDRDFAAQVCNRWSSCSRGLSFTQLELMGKELSGAIFGEYHQGARIALDTAQTFINDGLTFQEFPDAISNAIDCCVLHLPEFPILCLVFNVV
jgi:hypothetical protein